MKRPGVDSNFWTMRVRAAVAMRWLGWEVRVRSVRRDIAGKMSVCEREGRLGVERTVVGLFFFSCSDGVALLVLWGGWTLNGRQLDDVVQSILNGFCCDNSCDAES